MRAVIQRVLHASVEVDGKVIASIGKGLLVLVGFIFDDTLRDAEYLINKILGLRIFDDENGVMNLSVEDQGWEILLVSQFTLYGDARKGKRPSYSKAMAPEKAAEFYGEFFQAFKNRYAPVQSGEFRAAMDVSLVNSGPVTILLDSRKEF